MNLSEITIEEEPKEIETRSPELILQDSVDSIVIAMKAAEIKNDDDFVSAQEWLKKCKNTIREVENFYDDEKKSKHEAWKAVCDKINQKTDLLKTGEKVVKQKLGAYQMELDKKRREAEEKARKEEEARLKVAEEKAKADAKEKGIPEEIIQQMELPVNPAPVAVPKQAPKVSGVSFVTTWKWELVDLSQVPLEYLMIDEKKVNGVVRSMKKDTNIPGIEVIEDKQVRA